MMLGSMAVTAVANRINAAKLVKTGAANQYIRAYKYEKGEKETGEYIAVNHLPFTHAKDIEDGVVNVNVHVPKLKSGEVPTLRLETLCNEVIALFPRDTYINGSYYSFSTDSRPMLDNDDTYYTNLQIKVVFGNQQSENNT